MAIDVGLRVRARQIFIGMPAEIAMKTEELPGLSARNIPELRDAMLDPLLSLVKAGPHLEQFHGRARNAEVEPDPVANVWRNPLLAILAKTFGKIRELNFRKCHSLVLSLVRRSNVLRLTGRRPP